MNSKGVLIITLVVALFVSVAYADNTINAINGIISYQSITTNNLTVNGVNYTDKVNQGVRTTDSPTFANLGFGNNPGLYGETAPNRPLTTNEYKNVTVCASGCNYTKIQDAINQTPLILRHQYKIWVENGTYDEDLYIPPLIVSRTEESEGSIKGLFLRGATNGNVSVRSIQISSNIGTWATWISYFNVTGREPRSDENVSIAIYGSPSIGLANMTFSGSVSRAIMAYSSGVYIHSSNFMGQQDYAINTKRGGFAMFGDVYKNQYNFGSVNVAVATGSNSIMHISENNQVTAPEIFDCHVLSQQPSLVGTYKKSFYCQEESDYISDSGLVGRWNLKQKSSNSNIVYDSSKNPRDAIFYGNTTANWTNDGLSFDGVDDYINISANANNLLNFTDGATFSFIYKANELSQNGGIIGEHGSSKGMYVQHGIGLTLDDTISLLIWMNTSNYKNVPVTVPDTTDFHRYTYVWNNVTNRLYSYLDGSLQNNRSSEGYYPNFDNTTDFEIGRFSRSGYKYINGILYDVRVYNRALSTSEVRALGSPNRYNLLESSYVQTDNLRVVNSTGYTIANINNTGMTIFINGAIKTVCAYANNTLYAC